MTDDELLRALRDAERGEDVLADPRWEAFACGELSAEEERALRRRAAGAGLGDDVFFALRPPDDGREKRLIGLALREVEAAHLPAAQPRGDHRGSQHGESALGPAALSRRRRTTVAVLGGAFALAAGVFLWLRHAAVGPELAVAGDPLPLYTMDIEGGVREELGSPQAPDVERFVPGGEITILARPAQEVKGAKAVRAFLLREGRARRWETPIVVSEGGVVRIRGTFERLFGSVPPGRWELIIAISRSEAALPSEDVVVELRTKGGDGIRMVEHSIEIVGEGRDQHQR